LLAAIEAKLAEGHPLEIHKVKQMLASKDLTDSRDRILALIEDGLEKGRSPLIYSLPAYNALIRTLAERGHTKHASIIFNRLARETKREMQPNIHSFNSLLESYKPKKDYKPAISLLVKMYDCGIQPDSRTLHTMVWLAKEAGQSCFSIFDRITKWNTQIVPLVQTFNILIDCCLRRKEFDRVGQYLSRMQEDDVKPNEGTFNGLIKVMRANRDMEGVTRVYEEMKATEWIRPNLSTYNLLLKIFAAARDMPKTVALLGDMENAGVSLNALSYSCLVELNVLLGDLDKAEKIVEMMHSQGLSVWTETVPSILLGTLREPQSKPEEIEKKVWKVLDFSARKGIPLEWNALSQLLQHFKDNKSLDSFLDRLKDLTDTLGLQHRRESLEFLVKLCMGRKEAEAAVWYQQKLDALAESGSTEADKTEKRTPS